MKNILQVMGAMDFGGAETFTMNIFRNIDRNKYKFIFLCYLRTDKRYDYEDEIEKLGGKIIRIKDNRKRHPFEFIEEIGRVIDEERISVVHAQVDMSNAYAMIAAKRHDVPVRIAHSHNTKFGNGGLVNSIFNSWAKRAINRDATIRLAPEEESGRA
ncbi:glycosyltransferase, partial [Candidatus Saccharibacteria bacterium]|nr:glycosyltransferase [Candidatus Saccharibacteria bacterium]